MSQLIKKKMRSLEFSRALNVQHLFLRSQMHYSKCLLSLQSAIPEPYNTPFISTNLIFSGKSPFDKWLLEALINNLRKYFTCVISSHINNASPSKKAILSLVSLFYFELINEWLP